MRIRIINGKGWYTHKVGEVFEVVGRNAYDTGYHVEYEGETNLYYVSDGNYEIVDEDMLVEESKGDAVNHPNHYQNGRFETIEIIEEITKGYDDGFVAYSVGNALKYLSRAPFKHGEPTEDIRKAAKYLEFAIEYLTKENES